MEIRCSECGHLGEASDVRPVDMGVGLVCGGCGYVNVVSSDSGDAPKERDGEVEKATTTSPSATAEQNDGVSDEALQRLVPEPGSGARCRKCLQLLSGRAEHCPRCGLSVVEAEAYDAGEAPWEQPPEGKEDLMEEFQALFVSAVDDASAVSIDEFVDFAVQQGMIDLAIRRLQHHLIEDGDNDETLGGLERLAKSLEGAVMVARSRAEVKADQFHDEVEQIRSRFLMGALIFWVVILLLFSWLFWANF